MASSFDPFTQNVTFQDADGNPFPVPLPAIEDLLQFAIRININYAAQLGASIVLFIILLLLTRPEKRGSVVFYLNTLALVFNISRLISQCVYFTTGFLNLYAVFGSDYSRVPQSAYANSVMATVLVSLLLICIEASLVMQVQVVCATFRRRYRRLLLGVSILVALIPIGFRLAYMVENSLLIMDAATTLPLHWLESTTNITTTMSICFFCVIFVAKLGFAIKMRKSLGVKDFGPMKVIFVMGCQTLVIPALFSILQYAITVPELSSNVLTLVAISLPLSSIWAGVTLDSNSSAGMARRHNLWNKLAWGASTSTNATKSKEMSSGSTVVASPNTKCYADQTPLRQPEDVDCGYGIAVDHDISFHSYRKTVHPEEV